MASLPAALAASARATTSKVTLEALLAPSSRQRNLRSPPSRRRGFSSSTLRRSDDKQDAAISEQIRSLMRESAQPVALITTFLPPSSSTTGKRKLIHGATLSSFSSISLDPNLISFSMKTPSKLADSLQHHLDESEAKEGRVDFVVNVLADTQAGLAATYAVPGTPPLPHPPTEGGEEEEVHPLEQAGLVEVKAGSVPVVKGAIGAFGCQVVDSLDLSLYSPSPSGESKSILYIAKVVHVYTNPSSSKSKPLVYHRQRFVSLSGTPLS